MTRRQGQYSLGEEIANSVSHGIGTALSITGLVLMLIVSSRQGDAWKIVSSSIYGGALILLFLASTLYHAIPAEKAKAILKQLDHCAIYLLIAGSYTPFVLVSLRGTLGWTLFGCIWGLAFFGIALKLIAPQRFRKLRIASYVVMGWIVILAGPTLLEALGGPGLTWLVIGGLCYSGGVLFYLLKQYRYTHAIWHVFVLAGGICHFFSIFNHVLIA